MEFSLFKLHRNKSLDQKMILILICILTSLGFLQAEHYFHCISIFPDEIMDFPRNISFLLYGSKKNIFPEKNHEMPFLCFAKIQKCFIYSIFSFCHEGPFFFLNYFYLKTQKKILFSLQRYNSWNFLSPFLFLISITAAMFCLFYLWIKDSRGEKIGLFGYCAGDFSIFL